MVRLGRRFLAGPGKYARSLSDMAEQEHKKVCFRLGELFCGPGGMAIAAHTTEPVSGPNGDFSIQHTWGVDFSKPAIDTFKANLGEDNGIQMDARTFVKEGLTADRKINALAFGFPCNSFSAAGEQEGLKSEKFGSLYKCGVAVLDAYQPKWFVAENVSGIRACDAGKQFRKILDSFAHAGKYGYDVTAHLYKFESYGVPQMRHRYVIVGIRHDIAKRYKLKFRVPAPVCGPGQRNFVTVREALATVTNQSDWGGEVTRQSEDVIWRLRFTPPGENAWKLDEIVEYDDVQLMEYLRKNLPWYHERIEPLGSVEKIREKIESVRLHCTKARMSMIYRRLNPNFPSYTITGSGGGGTHVYHWEEDRALTNEERAALQTFPKGFVFKGSKEEVRKQIGMAVPTLGAKVVFEAILNTFAGNYYPFIEDDTDIIIGPTTDQDRKGAKNMSTNRAHISEKTLKVLFTRSQNRCAFPGCQEEIVDSTTGVVYGEVCHIEGVEAGAARHNPSLDKEAVNSEANLVLLCHKHHKLVDALPRKYDVGWLKEIKHRHELQGIVDISPAQAQSARLMLAEMAEAASQRTYNNSQHFEAADNAIQNITINKISGRGKRSVPSVPTSGTIGCDPAKRSYVNHLYDKLIDFKSKIPKYNAIKAASIVSRNVRKLFGSTWTNVPLSRYDGIIAYLQAEIDKTPIGRKNCARGKKNYSSYDEFMQKI